MQLIVITSVNWHMWLIWLEMLIPWSNKYICPFLLCWTGSWAQQGRSWAARRRSVTSGTTPLTPPAASPSPPLTWASVRRCCAATASRCRCHCCTTSASRRNTTVCSSIKPSSLRYEKHFPLALRSTWDERSFHCVPDLIVCTLFQTKTTLVQVNSSKCNNY